MKKPTIFAFTDCKDQNALTRLTARLSVLFEDSSIYGVGIDSDIQAAGCILDTLDALRAGDSANIIIGNLAPRADKSHKNGAPFYVGHHGTTVIVATRTCFLLLAKLGLVTSIEETDVETVCREFLPENEALRIANSQFRSFEYVPRLARWAYDKETFPTTLSPLESTFPHKIWWIDNFGNAKTTITEQELKEKVWDNMVTLSFNKKKFKFPFYQRLADVPKDNKPAVIIGSSGYQDTRFAEIVIQGKSVASALKLESGIEIKL